MENDKKSSVSFKSRPSPVFPSYRPMLRIGQILLILKINSYSNKASLLKLHLYSWGFKTLKNLYAIKNFVEIGAQSDIEFFGIEPTLNRALGLSIYDGLVELQNGMYLLTAKGHLVAEKIIKDIELFEVEKPILISIGKQPTEAALIKLQKFWKNA